MNFKLTKEARIGSRNVWHVWHDGEHVGTFYPNKGRAGYILFNSRKIAIGGCDYAADADGLTEIAAGNIRYGKLPTAHGWLLKGVARVGSEIGQLANEIVKAREIAAVDCVHCRKIIPLKE